VFGAEAKEEECVRCLGQGRKVCSVLRSRKKSIFGAEAKEEECVRC